MKHKAIYIIGILVVLVILSLKFYSDRTNTDEVLEQPNMAASWNALSAGSFIFN